MVFGSTKLKNECAFNSDNKAALILVHLESDQLQGAKDLGLEAKI